MAESESPSEDLQYDIQIADGGACIWIHASDGSTVGRFSRFGIDLHNTVTEQMAGAPQCRLCTHGRPSEDDWALFRQKASEWWGVHIDRAVSCELETAPLTPAFKTDDT